VATDDRDAVIVARAPTEMDKVMSEMKAPEWTFVKAMPS
jgi:hypothetical protein